MCTKIMLFNATTIIVVVQLSMCLFISDVKMVLHDYVETVFAMTIFIQN